MMETNEPGPADGDRKIEANVKSEVEKSYADFLKKEQDAYEAKIKGEANLEYEKIRKHGFATGKDIDEKIQGIFGKFASENEAMRQEIKQLREMIFRARAQGLSSGMTEDKPQNTVLPGQRFDGKKWW